MKSLANKLKSFEYFIKAKAKFRVAIINRCNMNCFFCHNEAMENPRLPDDNINNTISPFKRYIKYNTDD
jgi:molybdenum cofactor biosynthesis enzyme MoaA